MKKNRYTFSTNQLLALYLSAALIPLIITSVLVSREMIQVISDKSNDVIMYESQRSVEVINSEMNSLLNIIYNVATDKDTLHLCKEFSRGDDDQYYISTQLSDRFSFYMDLTTNVIQFIYITTDNQYMVAQRYQDSTYYASWSDPSYRQDIISQVLEENELLFLPSDYINTERPRNTLFYIALPIKEMSSRNPDGILIAAVSNSFFQSFTGFSTDDPDYPEILGSGQRLIASSDDTIIYSDDLSFVGKKRSDYSSYYDLDNSQYILTQYELPRTNWLFWSYQPRTLVFDSVVKMLLLILLLVLIFSVTIIYIITVVVSHHNKKIRRAELKTLEAQINPHFLYNTLDTINWMAIDKNEYKISKMISTLGSLLRYSVVSIDAPVLVIAEIEWLKKYLYLQEQRYHNSFTHTIDVQPGAEDFPIYKMLIQPLIENCILHAFHGMKSGGHIHIAFICMDNGVVITIKDNGCGMDEEMLEKIRSRTHGISSHTSSIGIDNVYNRLDVYYKRRASLSFDSSPDGTTARMIIPAQLPQKGVYMDA